MSETNNVRAADYRTPLKRVRGLGAAKSGTHHFIAQRVTAVALVFLVLWAIYLALALVHSDYAQAREMLHHPFAAVWLIAFLIAGFWHAQLGIQVVIEDYVHTRWLEAVAQLANKFVCAAAALAGIIAVVRIVLS
ncbi:MAG: succinate dehydrogenase, hydrophobic membrane anchor protein [Rudaea sp.]|uniref:succinate dehydrogenase, hydrophobic membrane anchor protein n=1 Tax=unclassified Rudaea TaxID=2627037 RepID=UPI0010F665A1|nr:MULTISPECIES: succinate dehydrogenase, hydrophobic membrane anchor protein [unclassified Rudaea]MBN8884381.1 succinate dehydrogenase, hydrophobic membrane anchor protein [Rudaea sp.]MBR0344209.1 succinate dehydrogenase, hydrophobic membrane anchor protein [Rudaea sp.]